MPQIILTENNYIDQTTLQVNIPVKIYENALDYKIGINYCKIMFQILNFHHLFLLDTVKNIYNLSLV